MLKGSMAEIYVGMILDIDATDGLGFRHPPPPLFVVVSITVAEWTLSLRGSILFDCGLKNSLGFSQVCMTERFEVAPRIEGKVCLLGCVDRLFKSL